MATIFSSPATAGALLVGEQSPQLAVVTVTSAVIPTANGIYIANPAGDISSNNLQAGTVDGQRFVIINQAAHNITMGAGTVSNTTTCVIGHNIAQEFVWSAIDSLWYPTSLTV